MQLIIDRIDKLDWAGIREELHDKGFAVVDKVLFRSECNRSTLPSLRLLTSGWKN
ncbi:MAG TPA: hypothetical protein VK518_22890 [Puia sp.]|nr:hypothetical protein [Puia sp.]